MKTETQQETDRLNQDCTCITLDPQGFRREVEMAVEDPGFCRDLAASHPHLLSAQPMFISFAHADRMQRIINAIETVARLPAYQAAVLETAPEIARFDPGVLGVFMGYDFHLGPDGPRLIEVNTNAGGALLNAYLLKAQRACCTDNLFAGALPFDLNLLLEEFVASFQTEWRLQGISRALKTVAIVDESPRQQYLYPEFVLFERLFQTRGLEAVIASPEELVHRDGALWCGRLRVDLVYNRLTDFYLEQPHSRSLRDAYLAGDVVLTPNPRTHALLANKNNLALLTDEKALRRWNLPDKIITTLIGGIPRTVLLTEENAEANWAGRNQLFFKPAAGFGGKAAYRGDKITKKVWAEILTGQYVAQEIVSPSARTVSLDGDRKSMKVDLRNYTYGGKVQLVAARLYQGQTTNFRTEGGGFAPVFIGQSTKTQPCSPR
jgi:hypothetical protein